MLLFQMELVESLIIMLEFSDFKILTWIFLVQSHLHTDSVVLFVLISYAFYAFGLLFIVCEIGHQVGAAFEKIWDRMDRSDWYSYPYEFIRMLPIIVIGVQQPVNLAFFGSISCSRFTFRRVREHAF